MINGINRSSYTQNSEKIQTVESYAEMNKKKNEGTLQKAQEQQQAKQPSSTEEAAQEGYKKLMSESERLRSFITEQRNLIEERIKNHEDGPKIQIGKKAMTDKEWKILLGKVDKEIDQIKEQAKKEEKIQKEKKVQNKISEKKTQEKLVVKKVEERKQEEERFKQKVKEEKNE